ncbi:hypothetical protein SDC9_163620 [bioreactor metagenome]|uniref:Uncharacterized protein n=1 Tax=bioreactor metagenome TaxID=1076179 RepID=A0A645FRN6_9ZZZZ
MLYYRGIEPETLRNQKSVAASGCADNQPVCRLKRIYIKFTGRVFDTVGFESISFQLGVVSSREAFGAGTLYIFENGNCESRAFNRIGSRAEFIEQSKRSFAAALKD